MAVEATFNTDKLSNRVQADSKYLVVHLQDDIVLVYAFALEGRAARENMCHHGLLLPICLLSRLFNVRKS
jgi:hypothetical protein